MRKTIKLISATVIFVFAFGQIAYALPSIISGKKIFSALRPTAYAVSTVATPTPASTKILLVNIVDTDLISPSYPIGVYTLKTYMKTQYPNRCAVEIRDTQLDSLEDIIAFAQEWKPRILGLSVKTENTRVLDQFMQGLNVAVSEEAKPLCVIGRHVPTFAYQELLKKYPQAVCVRGEGELALGGLLEYVEGKRRLVDVCNIAYVDSGTVIETERRLLDSFEKIGIIDYSAAIEYVSAAGDFWMETSRGCPWGMCRHCSIKEFWGKTHHGNKPIRRNKPIPMIIEELKQVQELGIETFPFSDEEFFGPGIEGVKRARDIARAIIENNIKISFHLDLRAGSICNEEEQALRIETLKLLKQAGLKRVFIGVETGSPTQLERINKGTDIKTAEGAIQICREIGLDMAIGWIMIDPLTSKNEILESIDFIRRNRILPHLSSPLNKLRIYRGIPYLPLIRAEEVRLGRKLVSDELNVNKLIFEVVGYAHPDVEVIADIVTRYDNGEYDLYNTVKWFIRFFHGVTDISYIDGMLGKFKEHQVELAYQLASLSDEELLQTEKPEQLLAEAIAKRDELIGNLKDTIHRRKHTTECKNILLQIEKYFAADLSSAATPLARDLREGGQPDGKQILPRLKNLTLPPPTTYVLDKPCEKLIAEAA